MKNASLSFVIFAILIAACTTTTTNPTSSTSTPDLISPSATSKPSITLTSEYKSKCPVENPSLVPNFDLPQDPVRPPNLEEPILDFLNTGGSLRTLISYLGQIGAVREENLLEKDLTDDSLPELVVGEHHLRIYTCQDQKYYVAADLEPWTFASPTPVFIGDMNQDEVPEIVIDRLDDGAVDISHDYKILEWDGQQFRNLIAPSDFENRYIRNNVIIEGWIGISGVSRPLGSRQWTVEDTDKNGTLELILSGGISVNNEGYYMGPWRVITTTYMWNGDNFVMHDAEYEPPQFRFQAVQDADYAVINEQYDKALGLYQQVISDDTLASWSEDMRGYVTAQVEDPDIIPTPTLPAPDINDRKNLTAYAYYRLMLLHTLRGNLPEAQTIYDTLQRKFPVNHTGHAYAELGEIFWTSYQASQSIGMACQKAIEFTDVHKTEILYYIGSNTRHGWQSFYYEPEDICPFK